MKALVYLFLIKQKAMVRKIFSRPSSAILTLLGIAFFIFLMVSVSQQQQQLSALMNVQSVSGWMMLYCGYLLLLLTVMILQKRTAIVTRDDAQFIFAGPFTRRQTLGFLLVQTVQGSLLYAVIAVLYMLLLMSVNVVLTPGLVMALIAGSLLMFYFVFALITWFYFWEMVNPHARKVKLGLLAALLLAIALIALRNVAAGGSMETVLIRFVSDPLFNWIPVFGWCKTALVSLVEGNLLFCIAGLGATLALCGGLTWMILNVKGDFYEKAMQDAEWISDLRQKMRRGQSQNGTQEKIHAVGRFSFGAGAAALISKNLLILRKTRRLLSLQEIVLIALYLGISWMGQGYDFYQFFILIVIFTSATTDQISRDLRVFYLYLIPERRLKKMLALTVPSMLHMSAVVVASLILCPLIFGVGWGEVAGSALLLFGYSWLFLCASLFCLRILKSRSTMLMEQLIKITVAVIAAIPSGVLMIFLMLAGCGAFWLNLAALSVNLLAGLVLLLAACPLLSGNNLMAD